MANETERRGARMGAARIILIVLAAILFVVAVAGASAWFLWQHSSVLNPERMFQPVQRTDYGMPTVTPAPTTAPGNELESENEPAPDPETPAYYDLFFDGKYYLLRKDVVAVLFMGIDSAENEASSSTLSIGTNQADTLLLGVFDTANGSVRVLHIPRDTEADIRVLDMAGQYVTTERAHLCLQHAYGDGGALSCSLTMDAVSSLLFGIPVNRYVSMGTKGVVAAVNAIGGVTLTMMDDFSAYSAAMACGKTVTLNGNRAIRYIQARSSRGLDGTDQSRMARQMQFMRAFIATAKEQIRLNPTLVLSVYEAVKEYIQTDLSLEELLFLANMGLDATLADEDVFRLPGTVGDEEQPLFHMDTDAARGLILKLFYAEIPVG